MTSKKGNKRRALRNAFVVTTGMGVAAMGVGCSDEIISNPPMPDECPSSQPESGDACGEPMSCNYPNECGSDVLAECGDDGTWSLDIGTCNPPPPDCPSELPVSYTECNFDPEEGPCSYEATTACGSVSVSAQCDTDEVWTVTAPACTPTAPACSAYTDASLCAADTTCRWLVPGCDAQAVFATGCYPIADCAADACAPNEACTPTSYDPCWNDNCDACGAPASLCLAIPDGGT